MSDLISRSALIERIKSRKRAFWDCESIDDEYGEILYIVNKQPTVESIPKEKLQEIVERLEEIKNDFENGRYDKKHCEKIIYQHMCVGRNCFECVLSGAIEIVKEVGGMNET